MTDTMRPVVLSVRSFKGLEPIDGGDTIVVRFEAPDGRELALVVPTKAVRDLRRLLDENAWRFIDSDGSDLLT